MTNDTVKFRATVEWSFAVLRALSMLGGMVALFLVPIRLEHQMHLAPLAWAFVAYKALLFLTLRVWPSCLRSILLGTTASDLVFVSLFVWFSGGIESHFYLLFYILVALAAAHFGAAMGLATAGCGSVLYVLASVVGAPAADWHHLTARVATYFLVGGSLGYLSERERLARAEAERLNEELREHQTRLEKAYEELQAAQARLVQSERLAAIGQMSAKVSHEVRNPLSSISLNAELLEDELLALPTDRRGEAANLVAAIRSQVEVLSAVTEEYLRFARLPKPKMESAAVASVVEELAEFVREELRARKVELVVRVASGLPMLRLDSGQIRQALLNLIRNAAEAMPDGGTITVTAAEQQAAGSGQQADRNFEYRISNVEFGEFDNSITKELKGRGQQAAGRRQEAGGRGARENGGAGAAAGAPPPLSASAPQRMVEIEVRDTGKGVPAENLERIFEPFFTSKDGGTGLGLAISRQIAVDHGGSLTCENAPGGGAIFRLTLPIFDGGCTP